MSLLCLTRFTLLLLPLVTALSLSAGCFAHTPAPSDGPTELPDLDDGLIDSKMVFLMPPEKWEALKRADCESNPAGGGCQSLFVRAADRLRWGVRTDDAPGLVVHACSQGHALSCAAVDLLTMASFDNSEKLAQLGCPTPIKGEDCYASAELLAYACNTRRQAPACVVLADLFAKAEQPDPTWARRYRERACIYGGLCQPATNVASREQTTTME